MNMINDSPRDDIFGNETLSVIYRMVVRAVESLNCAYSTNYFGVECLFIHQHAAGGNARGELTTY